MHGKVRLARDTETGERVAVKIVEREGRKRLGGGGGGTMSSSLRRPTSQSSDGKGKVKGKGKGKELPYDQDGDAEAGAASGSGQGLPAPDPGFGPGQGSGHARFITPPRSPTASSTKLTGTHSPQAYAAARYGRWGEGAPSRPTYGDREREREREKARKRLLWTTDKKVKREIAIMKKCAHEHVVGLKEVIDDPQSKKIFMGGCKKGSDRCKDGEFC